jgi:DNA-binding response OmpR family regulator
VANSEKTLLIVDDDLKLIDLLSRYLRPHGWEVFSSTNPKTGLALLRENRPSLVILDVMMPEMNGIELLKNIRSESDIPVLMLTAKQDVQDRIHGLMTGADDYILKPVDPAELLARIESVLRRARPSQKGHIQGRILLGDLELCSKTRSVWLEGEPLSLTSTEFDILHLFAIHAGTILSRDEIMDKLRGQDWNVYDRSIDIIVSRLRQKLNDDPKHPKYLKTVWGKGYVLVIEGKKE